MLLRDVNEELWMYFIVYEGHSPSTGHPTKQDRNPNIFENNSDLLNWFFFPCLQCVQVSFGDVLVVSKISYRITCLWTKGIFLDSHACISACPSFL